MTHLKTTVELGRGIEAEKERQEDDKREMDYMRKAYV